MGMRGRKMTGLIPAPAGGSPPQPAGAPTQDIPKGIPCHTGRGKPDLLRSHTAGRVHVDQRHTTGIQVLKLLIAVPSAPGIPSVGVGRPPRDFDTPPQLLLGQYPCQFQHSGIPGGIIRHTIIPGVIVAAHQHILRRFTGQLGYRDLKTHTSTLQYAAHRRGTAAGSRRQQGQ